MKIGIVSDTHGDTKKLKRVVEKEPDIKLWIHAGDGIDDCVEMRELFSDKEFFFVRGNNDYSLFPYECWFEHGGQLFWITHGHREKVKQNLHELIWTAKQGGANIVLFGHTHRPLIEEHNKILFINPGSVHFSHSYGIVHLNNDEVFEAKIFYLDEDKTI